MEYWWYKKTDDVKHTGIILYFDDTPTFSLDFGGDLNTFTAKIKIVTHLFMGWVYPRRNAKTALSNMILDGMVTISYFHAAEVEIIGSLVRLPINNLTNKEKAISQFEVINNIDIGKYRLMENNCRTYVIAVARLLRELPEFTSENWNTFEEKMLELLSEDQAKFKKLLDTAESSISLGMMSCILNRDLQPVLPAE